MQIANPNNSKNVEARHDFVCRMKKCFPVILWYLLGVATPFVVLSVLAMLDVKPPKNKAEKMIDKWHIEDCNDTLLLVSVPVEPDVYFTLGMERDPNTGWLREVGITRGKNFIPEDTTAIFIYRTKGIYNTPITYYGSPELGLVWRDLNLDGRFDQRINYKSHLMEINIGDTWVTGKGKTEVKTDKGIFYFDPNTGVWKAVP